MAPPAMAAADELKKSRRFMRCEDSVITRSNPGWSSREETAWAIVRPQKESARAGTERNLSLFRLCGILHGPSLRNPCNQWLLRKTAEHRSEETKPWVRLWISPQNIPQTVEGKRPNFSR